MSTKRLFYIAFFAVLVIGFYLAMGQLIPGFTTQVIKPLGTIRPFTFYNQNGQAVTEKAMAGKVTAVEYFFTTCRGICPRMNNNMRKVYDTYKGEKDFLILSHTCDPLNDNPDQLKRYADSMKVDTNKWVFLTGRKDSLYNMARHVYKIDDPKNNVGSIDDDFLHTQFIALVNKKGDVMKVYDALKESEIKELKDDIARYLKQ
ncbi:SCO family protein [Flavisolibacter tropicus]|uniref:Electron transporter SenC n=1 Tax=Flavisolibacter tropicus TaxID=1492898 RepID=A0A172TY51_9BACT|nr:SCO family protein [Flavisolibacter tropicus]ANE51667.1 electron transporter SenC [Flavisolibacter tropicus]